METMLMLGQYVFGLNTAAFQELNRSTAWRWGAQDVYDALPALQFVGWGEDTITLPGVIFPEYWGGTGQLDALRALGDQGQPQSLIDGRGNVLGLWVITSVTERQSLFAGPGVARRQEFTVTLRQYPGTVSTDSATSALQLAADAAPSLGAAYGVAQSAVGTVSGLAGMASSAMSAASKAVAGLSGIVSTVQSVAGGVNLALSAATSLQSAARNAQAAVGSLGSVASLADATGAVSGLVSSAANAARMATSASGIISLAGGADSTVVQVNSLAVSATRVYGGIRSVLGGFQ